jgi:interleukin-1 receptor-associated kinase 4
MRNTEVGGRCDDLGDMGALQTDESELRSEVAGRVASFGDASRRTSQEKEGVSALQAQFAEQRPHAQEPELLHQTFQQQQPYQQQSPQQQQQQQHVQQQLPHLSVAAAGGRDEGRRTIVRFTYEALSKATKSFEKRLGGGGCGSVFQGVLASGTHVAVKRLELGVSAGADAGWRAMTDQMRTEVEVLSKVQHVNIVPLLGWSWDGMSPCLVYAFMEGGSLQDRLACRGSGSVPLTANERILVLCDVARGLAYLHSEVRVIHRDVKSANVLLDRGCLGRIGDFGIARSLNDNSAGITVTHMHTEHVMGTQVYMAPEYKNGNLSTKVDAFAFGLVVIETLTGYDVCSPAQGHRDLLSMFEKELDTASKLLAHLDKRACSTSLC